MSRALGRKIPKDFNHIAKYGLTLATTPEKPVPVTVGINWYSDFEQPEQDKDGKYWVGKDPQNLGRLRGGHCICMPHSIKADLLSWYKYYDQGEEGACVGFGSSRMMSLLNRKMYNPWWLWNLAKDLDEWPETKSGDNEGTSVRAAMDVLRSYGHVTKRGKSMQPNPAEGIAANRWATHVDQLFEVLQNEEYKKSGAIPFLNSWGLYYPRVVWMPCETWQKLMSEDGEFTMIVDK
jgi:hypothetical protein